MTISNKRLMSSVYENRLARENAEAQGLTLNWQQDDIMSTQPDTTFDLIFDRGCCHVLPPEHRQEYINTMAGLLKPGGYFFLKCFSHRQPGTQGPNRFTQEQIQTLFGSRLQVIAVKETVDRGTLDPLPRTLFSTMRREEELVGAYGCHLAPSLVFFTVI